MRLFAAFVRNAGICALLGAIALSTSGCLKTSAPDTTGSIGAATPQSPGEKEARAAAWRAYTESWGKKYDAAPGAKTASLNYARGLKAIGQRNQTVAVLQSAVTKSPNDLEILAAFGKALSEAGELKRAQEVLAQAHTPERPDWRVLSAQGAVADQLGDHQQAQVLYQTALRLKPNDAGILTNLGLSYALSKQLPLAESTLRQAANLPGADARTRQNLSLVLGLEGKFAEAEQVARADMTAAEAAQSIASIKQMVSQANSWSAIKNLDRNAGAPAKTSAAGAAPPDPPSANGPNG